MNKQARYKLNKLQRRYLLYRYSEIVLQSLGISLLIYSVLNWVQVESLKVVISILSGLGLLIGLLIFNRLHLLQARSFTQYLNEKFPSLKQSADLMLLEENELTSLQRLQQLRTIEQFNLIFPSVKLPHHIVRSFVILTFSFVVYFFTSSFSNSQKTNSNAISAEKLQEINKGVESISIRSISITIDPPAYTALKSFRSNDFNLHFAEGSNIQWQIEFSRKPKEVKLLFSGKDSINVEAKNNTERKFFESGFYQIQWSDDNNIHRSDYYQLEVIKDQPPKVELKNLQQFTKLKYTELVPFTVSSTISDDYGVSDAMLIATVSKGSGESVKFREEKLRFTSPKKISGKSFIASRSLDLKKLGLEPGDELYFYAEAWDNKIPSPNYSRTETFFIALQDTATEISSVDSGLGVDLMPEYFRSQRQIIIDTEKLLRDKNRISKLEFNSTSNELGYDQKVLRLRYGQFLGEEDEGGIGQEAIHHDEEEQDVTKLYGHAHDTKNEHNLVEQKKDSHKHEEAKNPEEKEDPIKAFVHSHDNSEEATFFIQSLKAKLKAAVTIMWDAELYLRLYQPEKSLPFQYKALNLLKEISNDSRVYVHRSGFDPPPLKEEKRLTADLSEVKTNTNSHQLNSEVDYPAIRQALVIIEELLSKNSIALSKENRNTLSKAGQELSGEAIQKPLIHLKSLSLLKSLSDGQVSTDEMHDALIQIRKSFWKVLPQQPESPNKQSTSSTKLDQEFLKSFEKIRNE